MIKRRKFLVRFSLGTVVMIGTGMVGCGPVRRTLASAINELDNGYKSQFSADTWFEVTARNEIILHSPKVEMGQGVFTGMAQLAAEELGVAIDQIKVVHAVTAGRPVDPRGTAGSDSISGLWQPLRELAANMREMLRHNAAAILLVPVEKLTVEKGIISGNGKAISFGEVVQRSSGWQAPKNVQLKDRKNFSVIGKAIPRLDLYAKVTGEPIFGMDAALPDMLYGVVVHSPLLDTVFAGADIEEAQSMTGVVKVVQAPDFVGVVATTKHEADKAAAKIRVTWKTNKIWQQNEVDQMMKVGQGRAVEIQKKGTPGKMLESGEVLISEYATPIGAHAQLEPSGALAWVHGETALIKISTQVVALTRKEVADRLGLKKEQVEIHPTYLGGGFGRRLHTPHAVQAALLSREVGAPVHVFFSRADEFQQDTFRPPTHHVLKGKLDKAGRLEALEHHVSSGDVAFGTFMVSGPMETILGADAGAWRGGMIQYTGIPHYRAVSWRVKLPFATSWWRGLGLLANTFAIESFMDELAYHAGKDPVEFRLAQIEDDERGKRLKAVIKAAADKAGWGAALPAGRAVGFAACTDANTPVAQVVEVSIQANLIKIHKVTCAIDPGVVVNPGLVKAQCEGAVIMGISAALFEKMEIKNGAVQPTTYGAYKMALMKDTPQEINLVLIEAGEKPSGVGEPPIGPIGAAIANAVFKLTGRRIRNLPLQDYVETIQ